METLTLTLHATHASGSLTPSAIGAALGRMQKRVPAQPRGTMRGQVLRLARTLALDDGACVELKLDIQKQGARARASARGPRAAVLTWAFHALAQELSCGLSSGDEEAALEPDPDRYRAAADAYLAESEGDVRAERERGESREEEAEASALLAWLADEGELELADDADAVDALASSLSFDDPAAFYEALLESDAIEDVFASESEMRDLVQRFRARAITKG